VVDWLAVRLGRRVNFQVLHFSAARPFPTYPNFVADRVVDRCRAFNLCPATTFRVVGCRSCTKSTYTPTHTHTHTHTHILFFKCWRLVSRRRERVRLSFVDDLFISERCSDFCRSV